MEGTANIQNLCAYDGNFSPTMYMAMLNKRFADAGLRDALIQSAIIVEGSADAALRGKQYNRGVRLYKIFYEALILDY